VPTAKLAELDHAKGANISDEHAQHLAVARGGSYHQAD
jgi:hypothetical protein